MRPPEGRIAVGDRVQVPGGRTGRVVAERLIASNGAWRYTIALEQGGTTEHFDFELKRLEAA
jgi:Zn-dependent membrane protease YugP